MCVEPGFSNQALNVKKEHSRPNIRFCEKSFIRLLSKTSQISIFFNIILTKKKVEKKDRLDSLANEFAIF